MSGRGPSVDLRTATRLWNMPVQIFSIGRVPLGIFGPWSWRAFWYVVIAFGLATALVRGLGFEVLGPGLTLQFVLPGFAVWWALGYAAGGGSPVRTGASVGRWLVAAARGGVSGRVRGERPVVLRSRARVRSGVAAPVGVWAALVVWWAEVVLGGGVMVRRMRAAGPVRVASVEWERA